MSSLKSFVLLDLPSVAVEDKQLDSLNNSFIGACLSAAVCQQCCRAPRFETGKGRIGWLGEVEGFLLGCCGRIEDVGFLGEG